MKKQPKKKAAKKVAKKTTTKKAAKPLPRKKLPSLFNVKALFYNTEQKKTTTLRLMLVPYTGTHINEPYEGVVTFSQQSPPYIEVLMPPYKNRNGLITL